MRRDLRTVLTIIFTIELVATVFKWLLFPHESVLWHAETGALGLFTLCMVAIVVTKINALFDRWYPYDRGILVRLLFQFLFTSVVLVTVRIVVMHYAFPFFHIPITEQIKLFFLFIQLVAIAALIFAMFGFHFLERWRDTVVQKERLEREKATVQYDNLKNQLNPHFLFNSLTSLDSLIFENPQLASDFLRQLAKVYRYVLEHKDTTLVPLATEVNFVRDYVHLLEARFGRGLSVRIQIESGSEYKLILPVTLQILIENAIKHNTTDIESPLKIGIQSYGDSLIVSNNLQVKRIVETSNQQGLENLRSLYRHLIDRDIEVIETGGSFAVRIPLIEGM